MSQAYTNSRDGSIPSPSIVEMLFAGVAKLADAAPNIGCWVVSAIGYRSRLSTSADCPVESRGFCGRCPFNSGSLLFVAHAHTQGSSNGRTCRMRFSRGLNVKDGHVVGSRNNAPPVIGYVAGGFPDSRGVPVRATEQLGRKPRQI